MKLESHIYANRKLIDLGFEVWNYFYTYYQEQKWMKQSIEKSTLRKQDLDCMIILWYL